MHKTNFFLSVLMCCISTAHATNPHGRQTTVELRHFKRSLLAGIVSDGKTTDRKHRYQPSIVRKYKQVIDLMYDRPDVLALKNATH